MKALIVIVALMLVLAHPATVAAALAVEVAVVGGIGWLTWQGLRAAMLPPAWRGTA
jgi:hypothetical protein